jgi:hypothetical protein
MTLKSQNEDLTEGKKKAINVFLSTNLESVLTDFEFNPHYFIVSGVPTLQHSYSH